MSLDPDRSAAASGRVLVAVTVVAVAAAVLVPVELSGIGLALAWTAVLVAVFTCTPGRPGWGQISTAVGIVAVTSVPGWRSAEWLTPWYLPLAAVTTGALMVGARSIRELVFAAISPVVLLIPAVRWTGRGVPAARAARRITHPLRAVGVGLLTIGLVLVFGALFAGADATFASLLGDLTPRIGDVDVSWHLVVALVVGVFTLLGCFILQAHPQLAARPTRVPGQTWTWAVPTGTVLVLYLAFLATQARAMFGGDDYVQRTSGLTYAEYARSGFWQLFAVTILTILTVTIGWHHADRSTSRGRILVRVILGGLCLSALAVVASALSRMDLYMDAFGATRLRITVLATEWWLGAVLIALLIAGAGVGTRHLARVVGVLTIGAALAFAAYNPDAQVARINVDRYLAGAPGAPRIDVGYLSNLSPDATDQLLRLPEPLRSCAVRDIAAQARTDRGWTGFDLARDHAVRSLRDTPITPAEGVVCPGP
ncbi:DUF4153 domain-containing protein [Williamsia sterculiae]|uniref:Uncharacterized protein n=1 Tax=Williamsia sterculiae TaxID=1344003 RepID=A0A1N7GR63_9NOCA|nr:DUF4173 domain-containing protein [Williamsia sterculiae]SIS15020.1 protein of unknown function [Williamsia sterculiae]